MAEHLTGVMRSLAGGSQRLSPVIARDPDQREPQARRSSGTPRYSRPSGSFCSPALLIRRNQKVSMVEVSTINSE
jgi:hypothetical protein